MLFALATVCALSIGFGMNAEARKGWFVGGGLAVTSADGDLDGSGGFTNAAGTGALVPGKLSSGRGLLIDGGYGFNEYIAFEAMFAQTHHTASSSIGLPDTNADVSNTMIGVRGTYPAIPDQLEIFGRFGLASSSVKYADYGLTGTTSGSTFIYNTQSEATFSGSGYAFGGGVEYFIDHVGLGLGITRLNIDFKDGTGPVSGTLPKTLNENFTQIDFTVLYHF